MSTNFDRNEYSSLSNQNNENKTIFGFPKDKFIRYALFIGVPVLILLIIIIIIVAVSSSKKEEEKKQDIDWEHIIPVPSEEEMKKLLQSAKNITTSFSQTEIQNIINNKSISIIHFAKGTYNLEMVLYGKQGIGLKISRQMTIILDKGVVFNVTGDPYKNITSYSAIRIVGVNATKEKPLNIFGTLEINGNRNPAVDKTYSGEWGMGLALYSSHYVNIQEINSYDNHGDGIYFGSDSISQDGKVVCKICTNVNIGKAICKHNYRNGISVISGTAVKINEMYLEKTNGTTPEAGIDFEPNNDCEHADFIINKIFSKENSKYGFCCATRKSDYVKAQINEIHSENDFTSSASSGSNIYLNGGAECRTNQLTHFIFKKIYLNYIEGRGNTTTKYIRKANWNETCRKLEIGSAEIIGMNKTL